MAEYNRLLDCIKSPEDLAHLTASDLVALAEEMREEIILTVSQTGGHLSSNLGVVELAIALHLVYNSPEDKILWDVGHQAYPHKLLTGRRDRFSSLRQDGGISGFVRRDESEHDPFGAGHASTAVSAALGLAKARDLRGGSESIIAVLGDGALTGGLALEGLNNARDLDTNVTVVLNDNEMSISENVTGVAVHLAKLRMAPFYQRIESRAKSTLERSPIGKHIARTAEGLSHGVTRMVGGKTATVFEELGFRYLGPIDGHNIPQLIDMFENAKMMHGPVLIHVVTIKGKGYEHAEANSRVFHGISGFAVEDGKIEKANGNTTFTRAFGETLVELAAGDSRIAAITAAMPDGTGLFMFAEKYPDRFFDVGIAESHAVTFAAGLAAGGLRPVVAVYSTFLQRSYDQIVHDVCIQNLPVVFALDRAGIVGEDGPTHHGVLDLSYMRHIPSMTIMAPRDTNELRDMLATAFAHDGPIALRYPRGGGPTAYERRPPRLLAIGQAEEMRAGNDVCIIAVGPVVYAAIEAAETLEADGYEVAVIDARFVKPLDENSILEAALRCKRLVVVEENTIAGGLGSAITELLASRKVEAEVTSIGVPDRFLDHGSTEALRAEIGLCPEGIAAAARELLHVTRRVASGD